MSRITISTLDRMKAGGEKIAMLTSYDASFTALAEEAGIDVLLVGDSLGMVVQGRESTLPVTVDEMIYHTANVARAARHAMIVADMPFMSHGTLDQALMTAGRLMKEGGAQMVKLEGGATQVDTVHHLTQRSVPVCAHLGLLPQSVHQLGGYRVQGRDSASARNIIRDASALAEAGAQLLVLECIPAVLAEEVARAVDIPVIGIGAGVNTDGQVLVVYDMLGISTGYVPSFAKNFLVGAGTVQDAIAAYVAEVRGGTFPAEEHSFS